MKKRISKNPNYLSIALYEACGFWYEQYHVEYPLALQLVGWYCLLHPVTNIPIPIKNINPSRNFFLFFIAYCQTCLSVFYFKGFIPHGQYYFR